MSEEMPTQPNIPPVPMAESSNPILPTPEPAPVSPPPPVTTSGGSKKGLVITGLIALSAIVILGVLTFSIQNSTKEATTPSEAKTETPTATPTAPQTLTMEVTNVTDNEVVSNPILKITGNTNISATVTITGGKEDILLETAGTFSTDVSLNNGENALIFTAIDDSGNQKVLTRNIFYTTEVSN